MAILNNNPLVGASGNQGGYNINNSLRFRSSASAYLSRTPASAGSTTIGTFSNWLKLGAISTDRMMYHVAGTSGNNNRFYISFNADNTFQIVGYNSAGSVVLNLNTTQVLRDPSAWYNIVVAIDTTQATSSNRAKLYINGTQVTAFSTATYPSQNQALGFTNNTSTLIGANQGPSNYFDGYMAEVNFIDGSAKTPSDFGETDTTTGVWKPKAYTGTYGTNGFYLKFSDIATTSGSNAGLGKDFSGNSNYWTTNNISVTSGTTYDAMTDVPTNTSATVANYCVLNPLKVAGTLSNANLTYTNSSGASWQNAFGTFMVSSGKWYWEGTVSNGVYHTIGVATAEISTTYDWGTPASGSAWGYIDQNGNKLGPGAYGAGSAYGATYTSGDIIGVALDSDTGTLTFYKNGVSQGTAFSTNLAGTLVTPIFGVYDTSRGWSANFGQRPFSYTPPTGYVALNTYNLPTPTILQGNKYMDATLYTGNGANRSITNASAFKPDAIWIKTRSAGAYNHHLVDSVRGANKNLRPNLTGAEDTTTDQVTAINSNGFSLGVDTAGPADSEVNVNGNTYVAWQWQAGQGSTSSNTSGSITSTVSVNTTAGFSVVTYTGNGTIGATVGHGLGVAPSMIIVKQRNSTESWATYHKSLGATQYLNLNQTMAAATSITRWNNTTPSSTVITFYNDAVSNGSGSTYVAYCWADVSGYSKAFSYTGNGSSDGVFTYLGFSPKFILIKNASGGATSSLQGWIMLDTSRSTYNVTADALFANNSNASSSSSTYGIDILSNGFKTRGTDGAVNESSATYIGIAFASNPFKNSNAR